jgi:HK97 family phage major capsid protein
VTRERVGKSWHILSWPLGLDASYTPKAAEPRNKVVPLKELLETIEPEPGAGPEASNDAAPAAKSKKVILPTAEQNQDTEDMMPDQIKAMLQQVIDGQKKVEELAAEVKGIKDKLEAEPPTVSVGTATPGEIKARLDPLSGKDEMPFKSFGEQLQAVYKAAVDPSHPDQRLFAIKAPLGASEGTPSDGGWLVQSQFSAPLWEKTYEAGQLMQRVNRQPIGAGFNRLSYNQIDESSRANGSRWGGIQMYWANEAGSVTATKPKLEQKSLALEKLMGVCYATDELIADTTALEAYVNRTFPKEAAFKVELAMVRGGGAGTPMGLLASPALVSQAKETGQAAATIVSQNIMKMWSRMWTSSRLNAIWLVSQDVEPQLWGMSQTVGTGGQPVFLPPGGLSQSPYATLFSRPIIPCEYTSVLGTVGDIILWDPTEYMLIDKGGVQPASSIHVAFLTDEMTYRFTFRVNGMPQWSLPLTPYSGGPTVSPFVALATRA